MTGKGSWANLITGLLLIIILFSCSEESPVEESPAIKIVTIEATGITATNSISGGTITAVGATVTARGVCWSTSQAPTTADNKTEDVLGAGDFSSSISGLLPNTLYYV
jgi:hypothetical protein